MYFDIVIYCPLDVEFREVCEIFHVKEDMTKNFDILCLSTSINGLDILVVAGDEMGVSAAQAAAARISRHAKFSVYVCLGICGAISDDVALGEVCYTGSNFDITQNQKVTDADTELSATPYRTPVHLANTLNYFRKHPFLVDARRQWEDDWQSNLQRLRRETPDWKWPFEAPLSHVGSIFTGPVSAGAGIKSKIKKIDRKALAVETEVGGVFSLFHGEENISVITIRGVADNADADKAKLESTTKGAVRRYAVRNAAHFLLANIAANPFFKAIFTDRQESPIASKSAAPRPDLLHEILARVTIATKSRLRQSSPEFRDRDEHYWVPAPRLISTASLLDDQKPIDITEALSEESHIHIEIPLGYPDRAAAHFFSLSLLSNAINGKVLVPIFVDGKTFAPPRSIGHFCSDVSQEEIEELSSRSDCYLVFVVKDYPAYSETRVNHLIAELGAIPNNLSIVFTEESQATREVPSIDQSFFTEFKITSVSFANITYFIRRHFGLDHVRAESIALRLSETFDAFDLPAHPSYFAGIPRDFLTRLIEANRRAELIELAVMGFLTIAVVDDDSKVRLSRTTRRRFLSNLLYRMELKGENLSSKNLVEIARSICIEHDYDVVPEKFLSAFFDFGILKYNGKYLEFGIPFIRSYLLAELLASNKSDALKYFDFESNDFDFLSFSLYCETAGGAEFVEICSERLQEDIVDFSRYAVHPRLKSERHALFDAEVSPQLLRNRSAIVGLKERFAKEADAMLSSDDDAEKKQELMDMKLSTRESVYHRHKEATPNKRNTGRRRIVRDLDLATILIGGGAEHLNRFQKRDLAEKIIKLSGLITNDWFRNIGDTDYFALKEEVYTDVRPRINEKYPNLSDEAVRKFVEFFVDIIELGEYMGVLPSMLTPIDDAACHAVLAATLEGVEDSSVEDELIKALWLISVDVSKGEKALKRVIKKMPRRAFNRIAVAQYLVGKAYWSASSGEERLEILAAAEMAVSEVKLTVAPPSG